MSLIKTKMLEKMLVKMDTTSMMVVQFSPLKLA